MQILTQSPAGKAAVLTPASKSAVAPEEAKTNPQTRPLTDEWDVNGETFQSAGDLVDSGRSFDNIPTTYRYTVEESTRLSQSQRLKNAIGSGLLGAAAGAAGGALVAGIGSAMSEVVDLIFRQSTDSGIGPLLPLAAGAVFGIAAAVDGYRKSGGADVHEVEGLLSGKGEGLSFYPDGQVNREVSLARYQNAKTPELSEDKVPQPVNTWKSALKGAGIGVFSALPVVNFAAPAIAGGIYGRQLDRNSSLGMSIGLTAGAAASVAIYTATSQFGLPGLAVAAGTLGVAGAILKPMSDRAAAAAEAAPRREFGEQWWN